MKRMIFHIPYHIDKNRHSGSHIRPVKMKEAFENIGYQVDLVSDYGKVRKKSIEKIKENINNGVKYDFCYSESSTMPTLLTESHHLPTYPFLDFGFFKFLRKNGIRVGLFYRDCYWLFNDGTTDETSSFKRFVARIFYKYDLKKYPQVLDHFYLPTILMKKYIPMDFPGPIDSLPPGIDTDIIKNVKEADYESSDLRIFYVGGIGPMYDMEVLFKVCSETEGLKFTVCCREDDWEENKHRLEKYVNENIKIIHKSGPEFKEDIEKCHIGSCYFQQNEYRKFAMSVKLFEYLGYKRPVLSVRDTAVGEFVEDNRCGWNLDYDEEELKGFLLFLKDNKNEIKAKRNNIEKCVADNTWEARAKKVAKDLS